MRRMFVVMTVAAASLATGVLSASPAGAATPAGFTDTAIASPAGNALSTLTGITAMADGRALITQKAGALRVLLANGTVAADNAITLAVCTDSEEGLLGAASDPAFATNGFVYLYYTHKIGDCSTVAGRANRVSRFKMTGNTVDPASEKILLDNMNIPAGNHNGGNLEIGGDGKLYVSVGDGGQDPRGRSGPNPAAQDKSLLNGKILRINLDGTVPADNPFVGATGARSCATAGITTAVTDVCTEIYDFGLRNPYRFAFDPNSGNTKFNINDVGEVTWEEVDAGGKGLNYGWRLREGTCNVGSSTDCPATPAGFTDPVTEYNHNIGCSFITAGTFVPNGVWPSQYTGSYLFADGGCGKVWNLPATGPVNYDAPFATTTGLITDMTFVAQTAGTALFYVTNSGTLRRIDYTPSSAPKFVGTPNNVTAIAPPGSTGIAVNYPLPPAADDSGAGVTPTCTPAPGTGFPVGSTTVSCTATNSKGSANATFTVTVIIGTGTSDYAPLTPGRLADTRPGHTTVDGQFAGTGAQPAGSTLELTVAGRGGVAADAAAASLNVTATNGVGAGFLTVFPCGSAQPLASNLNYTMGSTTPNAVVTKIGAGGKVCIFNQVATDLVVDVGGYFPATTTLTSINPARLYDSRVGFTTVDGVQQGEGQRGAGTVTPVQIVGRAGVPAGSSAAVINLTVTDPTAPGYATIYPCGTEPPTASNVNYVAGSTVAALAVTKIGTDGKVCVFTQSPIQLVVDVDGYFPAMTTYASLAPARLLETRPARTTIDGQANGIGARAMGTITTLQVGGRGGVAVNASTAVLDVTVTDPAAPGFVTVYPCGIDPPLASNLNFAAGQTIANSSIVKLGTNGTVCIYNSQPTDLVVDVAGYFVG